VLLSATGLLARTATADLPAGTGGRAAHDVLRGAVRATARGQVGVVTSRGRVVRLGVVDTPVLPPTAGSPSLSGGAPLREFVSLADGEGVVALCSLAPEGPGLALATAQGVVKRVAPEPAGTREAWDVITLKDGDSVAGAVELSAPDADLVLVTSDGQLLRFGADAVRPQGRAAGGVAGVRLAPGARVLSLAAVAPADAEAAVVVTVAGTTAALTGTDPGTAKVAPFAEYPAKGRGTGGVRCHRFLKGEDALVLAWVGVGPARACAPGGQPVELPPATGRRDGSGSPLAGPVLAVDGGHRAG
jgi:DNA gyrase subunit A